MRTIRRTLLCVVVAACLGAPIVATAAEPLLKKLARVFNLTTGPGQLRGEDGDPGDLWVTELDGTPVQWTRGGSYRSPIFAIGDASVYLLSGDSLVSIRSPGTSPLRVVNAVGVLKLIGIDPEAPSEVVVLMADSAAPLATLSLQTGAIRPLPFDRNQPDQQSFLSQIRSQRRGTDELGLSVQQQNKPGMSRPIEWTDVVARSRDGRVRNVSRCDGSDCSQPALSSSGKRVAFIKAVP